MTSILKLWPITVTHPKTKETIRFLGQAMTVMEAVVDGVKNCGDTFRPNQSGGSYAPGEKGGPNRVAVTPPDEDGKPRLSGGPVVFKSLREFEDDPVEPKQAEQGENLDFA